MSGSNMGILPYGLSYYDHLGASCSSSIAISTLLIGAMPKLIWSLGGFLFKHRSYSNQREHSCRYPFDRHTAELIGEFLGHIWIIAQPPLGTDVDRIRISVVKQLSRSFGGFLFKHRSYSNQREHSCRYPLDWHRDTPLGAIWSYLNLSLTPLGRFSGRIRTGSS